MKTVFLSLCSLLFFLNAAAQKPPMKWGKVPKEDFEMASWEADPDADAVVLGEFGSLSFDLAGGDITYIMDYHKRVKIFNKSAFDEGDVSIPFYSKKNYEELKKLKAQVILADGSKIAVKDFFEEDINEYYSAMKFAFPNLEEGCIIEYKYTKKSEDFINLEEWYFQGDIPVRWTEFRTEVPEWYEYVHFTQGRRAIVTESEISRTVRIPGYRQVKEGMSGSRVEQQGVDMVTARVKQKTYRMENVPALRPEKYITTMEDYYSKIQFQLQGIRYPYSAYQNVMSTWPALAQDLMGFEGFGDQFTKRRNFKKMWQAIEPAIDGAGSDEEKVAVLYDFIAHSLKWDETYSFTADKSIDDAFENKSANSGEFNLAMIALCRQAGIEAHPVLISTRLHGKMWPFYPIISQFNHVLAQVSIGDKKLLFDIGSANRPPDLLRMNSLNYIGWLVKPDTEEWINIPAPKDKEVCLATFDLKADGTLSGSINRSYTGYTALNERVSHYDLPDHKHIKEDLTERYADIQIDSIIVENKEEVTKPFQNFIYCSIPEAAQVSGDFIYLTPVINARQENPLKLEKREFAVDIPHGVSEQYILNLTIPEGYVIEELPEAVNVLLPEKGGKFQFFLSHKENTIQLISKISINQLRYEPEEYDFIKGFFDIIIEKQGEQIVLKKAT